MTPLHILGIAGAVGFVVGVAVVFRAMHSAGKALADAGAICDSLD